MATYNKEDWRRAGQEIVRRRVAEGFETITALSKTTGLSTRILGDLEHGRKTSYRPATLNKVEFALKWEAGAILEIVAGHLPKEEDTSTFTRLEHQRRALINADWIPPREADESGSGISSENLAVRGASSTDLFEGIDTRLAELRRRYQSFDQQTIPSGHIQELAQEDFDLVADEAGGHDFYDEDEELQRDP